MGQIASVGRTYFVVSGKPVIPSSNLSNRVLARSVQLLHPAILASARNRDCWDTATSDLLIGLFSVESVPEQTNGIYRLFVLALHAHTIS